MSRKCQKLLVVLMCALSWAALPPGSATAQEVDIKTDSRMEGYGETVVLDAGGATMTWLGFAFFSAIALLALFKDAKRTHLD